MVDGALKRDLKNIRSKTILIAPPGADFSPLAPLGIAQLRGFLESRNYRRLKVIDLRYTRWQKLKIIIIKFYARIGNCLRSFKISWALRVFKWLRDRAAFLARPKTGQPQARWASSLDRIINQAIQGDVPHGNPMLKLKQIQGHRLIGFSIVYPKQLYHALSLSRVIKRHCPGCFIVFGGPQISKHINYLKERTDLVGVVDGFVSHDGEEPLSELIYQLETSNRLEDVPNLFYCKDAHGYRKNSVHFSADKTYLIHPNFDDLDFAFIPIRASYGCLWGRCTFCTYRLLHPKCSQASAGKIVAMIKYLQRRYGISNFRIIDDFLTPTFLDQFVSALSDQKVAIKWWCFAALVPGFNVDICRKMQAAGCQSVHIGLESMSGRLLALMQKPHTPDHAHQILMLFNNTSIKVHLFVIFGFPTENLDEALQTLDYLKNNNQLYDFVEVQQFCLEEHTDIYNHPDRYDITKIYDQDKNCGVRLGYRYDVSSGMNIAQSRAFVRRARSLLAGHN